MSREIPQLYHISTLVKPVMRILLVQIAPLSKLSIFATQRDHFWTFINSTKTRMRFTKLNLFLHKIQGTSTTMGPIGIFVNGVALFDTEMELRGIQIRKCLCGGPGNPPCPGGPAE